MTALFFSTVSVSARSPLLPHGPGTAALCGWDPGGTPKELLAQLYLTIFFALVLMRDALYEAFGPLFYPISLFLFVVCVAPNVQMGAAQGLAEQRMGTLGEATVLADPERRPALETSAAAPAPGHKPSWAVVGDVHQRAVRAT